jgi:hypothetical protein
MSEGMCRPNASTYRPQLHHQFFASPLTHQNHGIHPADQERAQADNQRNPKPQPKATIIQIRKRISTEGTREGIRQLTCPSSLPLFPKDTIPTANMSPGPAFGSFTDSAQTAIHSEKARRLFSKHLISDNTYGTSNVIEARRIYQVNTEFGVLS